MTIKSGTLHSTFLLFPRSCLLLRDEEVEVSLLRTGLAETTAPDPPAPSRLRAADRAYHAAFDELARYAHLAA